ncbi:MAG: type 4a pilus biogenesis protein PilO [Planctomycetota bacterium]
MKHTKKPLAGTLGVSPNTQVAVAVVLILTSVWWFGIRVADQRRAALLHEEARMRDHLDELRETHSRPSPDAARPGEVDHALRLVNDALPAERESQTLVDELVTLVKRHGLNMESCATAPMRREPAFSELPLTLRLLGTFDAFYQFLLTLEASPQVMRVTGLDLRKVKEPNEPMLVRMELSLFFRPDD